MLIGFPVAFTLAALGLSFGFLSIYLGFFDMNFLQAIPGRIFGGVLSNELLLAIPSSPSWAPSSSGAVSPKTCWISMGQLFGPIRGGLGYSVIIVGFILGAITGTVAAQVIAMALISMPVMLRYGYNVRYITGVLAASGTITQLVPPSLVLIVMADQLGKSVGDMYLGAWGRRCCRSPCSPATRSSWALPAPSRAAGAPRTRGRCGLAALAQMPDGHHSLGRADLRGARHHDAGPGDADRSRRDGRHRRHRSRRDPPQGSEQHGAQDAPDRHRRHRHRRDHRIMLGKAFKN